MSMTETTRPIRNHKRTYSTEKGPGAFASLGSLPKFTPANKRQHQPALTTPPIKKSPVFSFEDNADDDVSNTSSSDDYQDADAKETAYDQQTTPVATPARPSSPPRAVPFPRRSASVSPPPEQPNTFAPSANTSNSARPHLTRGVSTPTIVLSNGKPLKSSLKSSSSTPSVNTPQPQPVFGADFKRLTFHTRAASAPATPNSIHKAVHFPDNKEAGLEDVRLFNRTAKPQAVSRLGGEETETETEGEPSSFPFPRFASNFSSVPSPMSSYEIDTSVPLITSQVPAHHPPEHANVHLESIELAPSGSAPHLTGTVLVRNVAFEKHVAVRFTLDEWQTTSEVRARHTASVASPPWEREHHTVGDAIAAIAAGSTSDGEAHWDRFAFTIKLEDHAYKLADRVLWMVVRYSIGGGAEWWDNNSGRNYRVGFRVATTPVVSPAEKKRTVSAPESALKHSIAPEHNVFGAGFDFSTVMPNRSELAKIDTSPTSSTSSLSRSSKLSLSNYVSPSVSPTTAPLGAPNRSRSPSITPSSSSSGSLHDLADILTPRPIRPAVTASAFSSTLAPPMKSERDGVMNLRWPWGGMNSPARMLSPLASPALTTPLPLGSSADSGMSTPREGSDEDLYKAFVQQWCFAQSSPARPPANDSVLVGS